MQRRHFLGTAHDPDEGPHAPGHGVVRAWQGRLRPRDERAPLRYTEADVAAAIAALLGAD